MNAIVPALDFESNVSKIDAPTAPCRAALRFRFACGKAAMGDHNSWPNLIRSIPSVRNRYQSVK